MPIQKLSAPKPVKAAALTWVPVGSPKWNGAQDCYTALKTKSGTAYGVLTTDISEKWFFYVLPEYAEANVQNWIKGRMKITQLTKSLTLTERKVYKEGVALERAQELAGTYLKQYFGLK